MTDATDRSVLKTAHNAAKALHRVGALDDLTMREMDRLCLPPVLSCGNTSLRCSEMTAQSSVNLTPMEAALARILFSDSHRVIGKPELMDRMYDSADPPFEKAIDQLLFRLRKKMASIGSDAVIDTRHGLGWNLRPSQSGIAGKGCA